MTAAQMLNALERAVWTAAQTFFAVIGVTSLPTVKTLEAAGVAAGLSVIKSLSVIVSKNAGADTP